MKTEQDAALGRLRAAQKSLDAAIAPPVKALVDAFYDLTSIIAALELEASDVIRDCEAVQAALGKVTSDRVTVATNAARTAAVEIAQAIKLLTPKPAAPSLLDLPK